MIAARAWLAEAARAVNSGHVHTPAFDALMVPAFQATVKDIVGGEVKLRLHYPGPLPFQPTRLAKTNATHRSVYGCAIYQGFATDPKTKKVAGPLVTNGVEDHLFIKMDTGRSSISSTHQG